MNDFNDIYYKVDTKISDQDFDKKDIDEKKELVDQELKNYLLEKIAEAGNPSVLESEHKDEVSTYDLVEVLGTMIPNEDHRYTLKYLTHYVINVAGSIQGASIAWWNSQDEDVIEYPTAKFKKNGLWDSITTHQHESYVKTFEFAYDIFQNKFMKKLDGIKVFVMTPNGATPQKNEAN